MPKLSKIPKVYELDLKTGDAPVAAIVAASEAEAYAYLKERGVLRRVTPAVAFELGVIGVPLHYAKPDYRGEAQDELPLAGGEVSHVQP